MTVGYDRFFPPVIPGYPIPTEIRVAGGISLSFILREVSLHFILLFSQLPASPSHSRVPHSYVNPKVRGISLSLNYREVHLHILLFFSEFPKCLEILLIALGNFFVFNYNSNQIFFPHNHNSFIFISNYLHKSNNIFG